MQKCDLCRAQKTTYSFTFGEALEQQLECSSRAGRRGAVACQTTRPEDPVFVIVNIDLAAAEIQRVSSDVHSAMRTQRSKSGIGIW